VFTLRDSGVNFVCCDMPEANTLTIGILATMAQYERELIADWTKKALAEKKKRGFVLGTPANLTEPAKRKERYIVSSMLRPIKTIGGRELSLRSCGILATAGLRLQGNSMPMVLLLVMGEAFRLCRYNELLN
ncbi:recombinase family protein, partial [Siphonobacter sp. BAB-5385]|uniref:recombinase family protein n=1 Tax=Siphonobacter sp. BAB-5385 TaxID=1864822 RepID=UPI0020CDC806